MMIRKGHVVLSKRKKSDNVIGTQHTNGSQTPVKCTICSRYVSKDQVKCLNLDCSLICHLICLAEKFLAIGDYVPTSGSCPKCRQMMLWGDIIRKFRGHNEAVVLMDDPL